MSYLCEAFKIPILSVNRDFVCNPYIPFPTLTYPIKPDELGFVSVSPQILTQARCFDIEYGSKNFFAPSYYITSKGNHGSQSGYESQKLQCRSQ